MPQIFNDILHDRLGTWPLAYTPYGGADYGEILSVAQMVGDGADGIRVFAENMGVEVLDWLDDVLGRAS